MAADAFIALGSNLGDRRAAIEDAVLRIRATPGVRLIASSSIMETDPVGLAAQPRFLNAVIHVQSTLGPHELLRRLLQIECEAGRDRSESPKWGPRTLDLDLLMYGDVEIQSPDLTIPHPRMHERWFVLAPLAEIAAQTLVPGLAMTVGELLCRQTPQGLGAER